MATKDITDYGVVSPGGNITTAVQAMFNDQHGSGMPGYVAIPPGTYVYNGPPLNATAIALKGTAGAGHTIVQGPGPLIKASSVGDIRISGLQLFYMANPIDVSYAPDFGGRKRIFDDVEFHACTGTVIRESGSDTPYFRYRDLVIDCPNAIGIETDGFTDDTIIGADADISDEFDAATGKATVGGVEFRAYRIGMKLNGVMQRMRVQAHFMHVSDSTPGTRIDVWIPPSHTPPADGAGVDFVGNWHGNEGRTAADRYFVFADSDAQGNPILDKPSTGVVRGINIERSTTFADYPTPYVFSTTNDIKGCRFGAAARRISQNPAVIGTPFLKTLSGSPLDLSAAGGNVLYKFIEAGTLADQPKEDAMALTADELAILKQIATDAAAARRAAENFAFEGHRQLGLTDGKHTGEDGRLIPAGLPLSFIDYQVQKDGPA